MRQARDSARIRRSPKPHRFLGTWTVAVILFVLLVAAGCGGDDDTESFSQPITDLGTTTTVSAEAGLLDDIVAALADQALIVRPDTQLLCVAEGAIAAVGSERLMSVGAPDDFDLAALNETEQQGLIDAMVDCADGALLTNPDLVGLAIPAESVSCLLDEVEETGLADDLVRAALATTPEQAMADQTVPIVETLAECLSVQEIAQIVEAFGLVSFLPGG